MNKTSIAITTIIILALIGTLGYAMRSQQATPSTPQTTLPPSASNVFLSWGKLNYEPQVIHAEQGKPLTITGDLKRLTGCFRSFQIKELGVTKYFTEGDTNLEFTPEKKGQFGFSCSMGMGSGLLVIT